MPHPRPPRHSKALLDPKNDFVFKKLFAGSPALLVALINAVRSNDTPVESVLVLNPLILPEELSGKFIELDILARDRDGRRFNIEMQVNRYRAYSARSAYYLAHTLTQQLEGGQAYEQIQSAIGIHLLDFELFTEPAHQNQAVWCFEMRDRHLPEVKLGDELQLNIIEMPKADRLGLAQPALAALVTFFKHWQEEKIMSQIAYAPVQQAMDSLKALSADDEVRHMAWVRERALSKERTEKRAEREEGKIEGAALVLERLLAKRFGSVPDDIRIRLGRATTEQVERWSDAILDAPSLAAVFADH